MKLAFDLDRIRHQCVFENLKYSIPTLHIINVYPNYRELYSELTGPFKDFLFRRIDEVSN